MSEIFYVLKDGNAYKLGITTKSAEERRRQLQTGNPRDITVFYEFRANDARAIETELHRHFKYCEIDTGGDEWFHFEELSPLHVQLNRLIAERRMVSTGRYNGEVSYWQLVKPYITIPITALVIMGILWSIWSGVFL